MIRVSAFYPNTPGATFDFDRYLNGHVAAFRERFAEAGIARVFVERGTGAVAADTPAPYLCIFHALIRDAGRFRELMAEHAPWFMADIPTFTNVRPLTQIGEKLFEA